MQLTRKMKLDDAKYYVAEKLGLDSKEISDEDVMHEVRDERDIGRLLAVAGSARGITAKYHIADLLEIEINSVNLLKTKLDLSK